MCVSANSEVSGPVKERKAFTTVVIHYQLGNWQENIAILTQSQPS